MRRGVVLVPGVLVVGVLVVLAGCESLQRLGLSIERPTASVSSVSVSRLDFREAELTTVIVVSNSNAVGIRLTGFAYTLEIEGIEFLSGDQKRGVSIAAFGTSRVEFPTVVGFENVLNTVSAVGGRNEAAYLLEVRLRFELPVLGEITVPLRSEGTFPIVRRPTVRVADLALESIAITGARLSLTLIVDNPNGFAFALDSLDYSFSVEERIWIDGAADRRRSIPANGSGEIVATFSLSFSEFGRTLRDLLLGGDPIAYAFNASATIDPDVALIPTVTLPVARSGQIDLRRR